MKKIKFNYQIIKYVILFFILLAFFSLFPIASDDWEALPGRTFYESIIYALIRWKIYSGRVFGQILFCYFAGFGFIKILFKTVLTFLLFCSLHEFNNKKNSFDFFLTLILFFGMCRQEYSEVFVWTSGFCYYVFPCVMMCLYLRKFKRIIDDEKILDNKFQILVCFFLGIGMNFFTENVTILSVFIGLFTIIISFLTDKKVYKFEIAFLIGTILGSSLMLAAPVYWGKVHQYRYDSVPWFTSVSLFTRINYNLFYDGNCAHYLLADKIILGFILCIFMLKSSKNDSKFLKMLYFIFLILNNIIFIINILDSNFLVDYWYSWSNRIYVVLDFLWYVLIVLITINKFKNQKQMLWMLSLIIYIFVCSIILLIAYESYFARCYFAVRMLLIIYVISYKNYFKCDFKFLNFYYIAILLIIFFSYGLVTISNYNCYKKRTEILKEASINNSTFVVLQRYHFYNYIHCNGEAPSNFHKHALSNWYKINLYTKVYVENGNYFVYSYDRYGTFQAEYLYTDLPYEYQQSSDFKKHYLN